MKKKKYDDFAWNDKVEPPGIGMEKTGRWLRCVAKHKEISVREISTSIGLSSTQSVYGWFCGHTLPSLDNLYALGYVFCLSMDDLIVDRKKVLPNRFCKMENRMQARLLCYEMAF